MGKLLSKIFGNKEMRILMLGLDAAGKTSESLSVNLECACRHENLKLHAIFPLSLNSFSFCVSTPQQFCIN